MSNYQKRIFSLIFAILIIFIFPGFLAFAEEIGCLSPLNPEFLRHMERKALVQAVPQVTSEGHALGYIPSPVDYSYLKVQRVPLREIPLVSYPVRYDLREQGKLTPVRSQGACGACWAFATYGSLESALMPGENNDFSENHLKNNHGFDLSPCSGGNSDMATAYLVRWTGPISEEDDPYQPSDYNTSPPGLTPVKHIQNVIKLPLRNSPTDNDLIKSAVMTWGGVAVMMHWDDQSYNSTTHAYYYNGTGDINHGVVIVGWDDNYPATNFTNPPPGNGAFIVRNDWGTSWGENGYFYISYYDTVLGKYPGYVFYSAEPINNYLRIYQYDPLGMTGTYGYGKNTAWFKNVFIAESSENLVAVGFYALAVNTSYEIYVYKNATLAHSQSGNFTYPGYYTVKLTSPVTLTAGDFFYIAVKVTTPGYNYPIAIEYPIPGYSSKATANSGQSYVSPDGTTWMDITTQYPNSNVCLKAYTTSDCTPPFVDITCDRQFFNEIKWMKDRGISRGWPDGTYRPNEPVTRAAMAVFIVRIMYGDDFTYPTTPYFTDVPPEHPFFKYIQKFKELGITKGCGDGTMFCPENNVRREEMAVFLVRAKVGDEFTYSETPYFSDVPPNYYFFKYIQKFYELGLTTGYPDGTFRPINLVTRDAMAAFLYRAFGK